MHTPRHLDFLLSTEPPVSQTTLAPRKIEGLKALSHEHQRLFLWTTALGDAFNLSSLWQVIRGFRYAAFGFADPDLEGDAFAVLAYAQPLAGAEDQSLELQVGQEKFPVFVRRYFDVFHAITVHPTYGRAACWATSRKFQHRTFLTAKHVAQHILNGQLPKIGDPIPTNHGAGAVADVGPDGIDAVLVSPPQLAPGSPQKTLGSLTCIAPWMDAALTFASGTIRTKVTSVTDTRGSLSYRLPARVYFADYGQPGDSGSLVIDPTSSDGIGLYIGAVTDPSGKHTEGVAQHLGQVVNTMGITLSE